MRCTWSRLLRWTLGERNPNPELDGLAVLHKPRNFEIFSFGRPSWFLQGPTSFSNLAKPLVELVFVAVVAGH